jgi:hypothetical protein
MSLLPVHGKDAHDTQGKQINPTEGVPARI